MALLCLQLKKIATFTDFWNKTLRLLIDLKAFAVEAKITDLDTISELVIESICAHQDVLIASEHYQKPINQDAKDVLKRIISISQKISDIGKNNKSVANHSEAVKNGLDSTFWLFQEANCDAITQTYLEAIDFAGNKILREKKPEQTKWLNCYKSIIKEINELVTKNYKCGLAWNCKGSSDMSGLIVSIGNTYRKNFKKSQEGEAIDAGSDNRGKLMAEIVSNDAKLKPVKTEDKIVVSKSEDLKEKKKRKP